MRKDLKIVPAVFPMPVLMIATYNEDGSVDIPEVLQSYMGGTQKLIPNNK